MAALEFLALAFLLYWVRRGGVAAAAVSSVVLRFLPSVRRRGHRVPACCGVLRCSRPPPLPPARRCFPPPPCGPVWTGIPLLLPPPAAPLPPPRPRAALLRTTHVESTAMPESVLSKPPLPLLQRSLQALTERRFAHLYLWNYQSAFLRTPLMLLLF